jgi:hypothetical protein
LRTSAEKRLALEVLEHHEGLALVLVDLVDDHDVLVVELCGRARLGQEAPRERARGAVEELDRDLPPEPGVAREDHLPHPAAPELADDVVLEDAPVVEASPA